MASQGPVARLFGSLANTLLDLGLPRIRAWLRERVGPNADVERVSTEGKLIHLDGVRLPIGPRGELVLDRATAIMTPARGIGVSLPELRLHAFRGVLSFTGADQLRAEVTFVASPDADEAAWVAGELTILRATWSVQNARKLGAAPAQAPMEGRARLVVTSASWSLADGALTSEQASVRFAGHGRTEATDGTTAGAGAIDAASLVLDGARVGPFVDAVQAVMGRPLDVPPGVPLDARLEGTLAWDARAGGQCTLHVTAEGLDARLGGQVGPDGRGLAARIAGSLTPMVSLRSAGVPAALLPRAEDAIAFVVEATGDAARPDLQATFRAPELGFRFGRPRFQPALVARLLEVVVDVQGGEVANVRASVRVGAGTLGVDGAVSLAKGGSRSLAVQASAIEASWIAPVVCAIAGQPIVRVEEEAAAAPGGTFAIPRDARFAAELVVDLGDAAATTGHVTMTTPRGALALRPLVLRGGDLEGSRLHGRLAIADTLRMNLFPSDVRPVAHGLLDVDLAVGGVVPALVLRGVLAAPELRLAIASRPDVPPFLLRDASASLTLDAGALAVRDLRFTAYGGAFTGESTIVLGEPGEASGEAPAPALVLACHDAHASFAEALGTLARGTPKVRGERSGPRPDDELWIPSGARITGRAMLHADLRFTSTLALTVPGSGTSLACGLVLSPDLRVDGSTLRGTVAIADALAAGAFDTTLRPLPEGEARIEATLNGPIDDFILSGFVTAAHLRIALHEGGRRVASSPVFSVTDLSTLFRLDVSKIVWHRLAARAYGGSLASAGVIGHGGAFVGLQATLAARSLSLGDLPVDDSGRTLAEIARGRVALDMRFDRAGTAPVVGRGDLQLDHGTFPVLARSRASLGKYGLSPPAEHAIAPATCTIYLHERGWSFCDARAAVPGCEASGRVDAGTDGTLDGALVVTLGPELLESSAVTVLPSLLAEHLTVPVRITGSASQPHIHADLAACFGNLFSDNRVSAMLSEAASDVASLFTGREPARPPAPPAPPPPRAMEPDPYGAAARGDAAEEDALIRDLVAAGADWDEIDARLEAHRRSFIRHRIG